MTPSAPRNFTEWLTYIEGLHPQNIEMGLDRVVQVYARMNAPLSCAIITVGGTNGKGSSCAMLEAMMMASDYRTGLYTSPHLHHFNERARINGRSVEGDDFVRQFEQVEAARGDTQLTYFEFTTLAIFGIFAEAAVDVAILEVGLGGRLDAVNILDADVAIVTNVGIDHVDYLGDTREAIGFEKAGIFRSGRPAICGDVDPPKSLLKHAANIGADLRLIGRDFGYAHDDATWHWHGKHQQLDTLEYPALQGINQITNASVVLAAIEALTQRLPVSEAALRTGLLRASLPGRFQILPGKPMVILDVAHNPHAAAVLAENLRGMGVFDKTKAVFGAMRDKDIDGVIACMKDSVDYWCLTDLPVPRAATAVEIQDRLYKLGISPERVQVFTSPDRALANALSQAGENDRIAVFGSFWTVAGATEADINQHT